MLSHDLRVAQLCLPFIEFDWPEFMPSTLDSLMKQVVLSLKFPALRQAGSWFSNQKKDIVRVGMYKRTKLHHQAWQMACLNNLYDNFCRSEGINDHPCDLMRHCRDRVPSWTADLLQVQNSGPFYHDQQIYLLQMFHISGVLQLPSSRPPMSICQKKIGDPLGKSLHHHVLQSVSGDQAKIWAASLLS